MHKFELFIGYFPGCIVACNKAVYEGGDYKTIAHISYAGNIKLYVKPDYIPEADMEAIKRTAARERQITKDHLEKVLNPALPAWQYNHNYARLLDECADYSPWEKAVQLFDELKNKTPDEKNKILIDYYLTNF